MRDPIRPPGRIVVVGEALVDLVIAPDGSVQAALGGGPFNTARTCGRLGADVAFIGALSDDRFGRLLRSQLIDDGVSVDAVVAVDRPTTLAAAEIDERGAATYRFYLDGTSAPAVARVQPPDDATVVHTGGLGLVLEPMADAVAAMAGGLARKADGRRPVLVVDVNVRPDVIDDRPRYLERLREVMACADVVKVSDDDLAALRPGDEPIAAAHDLLGAGPSVVLLTAGPDEVVVLVRVESPSDARSDAPADVRRVGVPPVDVVDTIGAGDAFGGAFCAWWALTGRTRADLADVDAVEAAARAAIDVAALTCTRRGAAPPRADELATAFV